MDLLAVLAKIAPAGIDVYTKLKDLKGNDRLFAMMVVLYQEQLNSNKVLSEINRKLSDIKLSLDESQARLQSIIERVKKIEEA